MLHTPFGDTSDQVTVRNKSNRIRRIQFGLLSPKDVLALSRVEIVNDQTWQTVKSGGSNSGAGSAGTDQSNNASSLLSSAFSAAGGGGVGGGEGFYNNNNNSNNRNKMVPVPGGLFSLEMGTLMSRFPLCETCGGNFETCPGHWGHLVLSKPVINICFVGILMKVLRCVCVYCSALLLAKNKRNRHLLDQPAEAFSPLVAPSTGAGAAAQAAHPFVSSGSSKAETEEEKDDNEKEEEDDSEDEKEDEEAEKEEEDEEEAEKGGKKDVEQQVSAGSWKKFLQALKVKKVCDHCGALQPLYKKKKRSDRDKVAGFDIYVRYPVYKNKAKYASMLSPEKRDILTRQQRVDGKLTAEQMLAILRRISDHDASVLGFRPPYSHPSSMIITLFPVPPPCIRPSLMQEDGIVKGEDDLTSKLVQIVKANRKLQNMGDVSTNYDMLQFHINTYFNNDKSVAGSRQSLRQNGKPLKTIRSRLRGKEGRMRGNLMGKRVKASARTVITPDPNVAPDEVGVPDSMAKTLTQVETVTSFNLGRLRKLLARGEIRYVDSSHRGGTLVDLSFVRNPACSVTLQIGDSVECCTQDGDKVLVNRQPTLWVNSMMGHRVRRMPGKSFRLNLAVCKSYNADFDGDEMNMHVPQTLETRAEIQELMMVDKNMIPSQANRPVMGLVQDALLSVRLMTLRNVFFTRDQFQHLLMAGFAADTAFSDSDADQQHQEKEEKNAPTKVGEGTREQWRRALLRTPPAIWKPEPLWTGKQLFSLLLPEDLSYASFSSGRNDFIEEQEKPERGNGGSLATFSDTVVLVERGELLTGIIDKNHVGESSQSLNQILHNDYGSKAAINFIYQAQRVCGAFLSIRGFSVGPSDLSLTDGARARIAAHIRGVIDDLQRQSLLVSTGGSNDAPSYVEMMKRMGLLFQRVGVEVIEDTCYEPFQGKAHSKEGGVSETAALEETAASEALPKDVRHQKNSNQIQSMILSGSKGSNINITQMTGLVGPQNVQGRMIMPQLYGGRTLATFPFSKQPDLFASGFVEHSFCEGITPSEFFFHTMGGREGLIDTAVKTSESGYIQRCLVKMMEDLQVQQDGSVRNSSQRIVQFLYGGHGFRRFLEQQKLAFFPRLFSFSSSFSPSSSSPSASPPFPSNRNAYRKQHLRLLQEALRRSAEPTSTASTCWQQLEEHERTALDDVLRELERILARIYAFKTMPNTAHFPVPLARWIAHAFSTPHPSLFYTTAKEEEVEKEEKEGKEKERALVQLHLEKLLWFYQHYGHHNLPFYAQFRTLLQLGPLWRRIQEQHHPSAQNQQGKGAPVETQRALFAWFASAYRQLWKRIEDRLERSRIPDGEMVGTQVAQNFGQQITQMVLNTFHLAGVDKPRVTMGIPRMRELINIPKKPKNPSMTLYLKPPFCFDRDFVQAFARQLECVYLHVMVKTSSVVSMYDLLRPAAHLTWEQLPADLPFVSMLPRDFVLRHLFDEVLHLQLSSKKLKKYGMDPFEVRQRIESAFPGLVLVDLLTSGGAAEGIHHIWIGIEGPPSPLWQSFFSASSTTTTATTATSAEGEAYRKRCHMAIKSLDQYLMKEMPCRGVFGINKTFVIKREEWPLFLKLSSPLDKEKQQQQQKQQLKESSYYFVETNGSNLASLVFCEELDFSRCYCNSSYEVNQVLGLEAARAVQFEELHTVMCSENSEAIYPSHTMLLVDVQTKDGRLMPITRHGMAGKMDEEPLNRASFEQTTEVLVELGGHGNIDNMLGVTDNIIMGQKTTIGTGKIQVLVDERRVESDAPLELVFSTPFLGPPLSPTTATSTNSSAASMITRIRNERVVLPLQHWADSSRSWDGAFNDSFRRQVEKVFSSTIVTEQALWKKGQQQPQAQERDIYDPERPELFVAGPSDMDAPDSPSYSPNSAYGAQQGPPFSDVGLVQEQHEERHHEQKQNELRNEQCANDFMAQLSRLLRPLESSSPVSVTPLSTPAVPLAFSSNVTSSGSFSGSSNNTINNSNSSIKSCSSVFGNRNYNNGSSGPKRRIFVPSSADSSHRRLLEETLPPPYVPPE